MTAEAAEAIVGGHGRDDFTAETPKPQLQHLQAPVMPADLQP